MILALTKNIKRIHNTYAVGMSHTKRILFTIL